MAAPLLLDTNLLVLLVTGLTEPAYITKNKRLATFDELEFNIVRNIADQASTLIFSPNVLSETSNFLRYVWGPVRAETAETLALLVRAYGEEYVPTDSVLEFPEFSRLGVADCVLMVQARSGATLLTDDLALFLASSSAGQAAVNYNYYREQRPDFR